MYIGRKRRKPRIVICNLNMSHKREKNKREGSLTRKKRGEKEELWEGGKKRKGRESCGWR